MMSEALKAAVQAWNAAPSLDGLAAAYATAAALLTAERGEPVAPRSAAVRELLTACGLDVVSALDMALRLVEAERR